MSYILDALRKADQQRQRGAAPTLLAGQATEAAPKQPAFLVYGLLAAVLVGGGIMIGWLRPWQSEQTAPGRAESVAARSIESKSIESKSIESTPLESRPLASAPLESMPRQPALAPPEMAPQPKPESKLQNAMRPDQAAPAPSEMAPQQKPEPKLQIATLPDHAAPAPSEMAPQPKPELPARAKPETDGPPREADAAAPRRTPAPPVDTAADAAGVPTVISMAELPPSVRQELPAMTISVHAYSDNPAARLVGINNRILREGDSVVTGLKLEQITPDGMIFGYKGYRFSRGVK
jgi:general secretion pathway protein B